MPITEKITILTATDLWDFDTCFFFNTLKNLKANNERINKDTNKSSLMDNPFLQ
jgi:hypothetical protein